MIVVYVGVPVAVIAGAVVAARLVKARQRQLALWADAGDGDEGPWPP